MNWYLLFIIQLLVIYLSTQMAMRKLFHGLMHLTHKPKVSFYILSLIYLPGTFVHEMSHFLTSIVLFVIPHRFDLIPEIEEHDEGYAMKFGAVHSQATDPFRRMLISMAPLIYGIAIFYIIFALNIFPHTKLWLNLLGIYLSFAISSSMFSSRHDLKQSLILIPLALLTVSALIGFDVDVQSIFLSQHALELMKRLNLYFASATIINLVIGLILYRIQPYHRR